MTQMHEQRDDSVRIRDLNHEMTLFRCSPTEGEIQHPEDHLDHQAIVWPKGSVA
jgi:hypothetical protein